MRRRLITAVAAAALVLSATVACSDDSGESGGKPDAITILNAGGDSEKSMIEGYLKPFSDASGIDYKLESPNELGKLQAAVQSGNPTDIVELDAAAMAQARSLGLIEKLDWDNINPDEMFPEAKMDDAFGWQYYSTILGWANGATPLTSWKDLWDVEKFPGKRTLPDYPTYAIPIALLADGVSPDKLYPLDLDRAFKSLDKIKDHVAVWWESGAQAPQLLTDKEVIYAAVWSGRIVNTVDTAGLGFTYNGGLLDLAYLAIPKGSKNKKYAEEFLHYVSIAENQKVAAEIIPYTGPSPDLSGLLPQDKLDRYPTSDVNKDKQVLTDADWWAENGEEAQKRWEEWKLTL